jgi:hypothetical protein
VAFVSPLQLGFCCVTMVLDGQGFGFAGYSLCLNALIVGSGGGVHPWRPDRFTFYIIGHAVLASMDGASRRGEEGWGGWPIQLARRTCGGGFNSFLSFDESRRGRVARF